MLTASPALPIPHLPTDHAPLLTHHAPPHLILPHPLISWSPPRGPPRTPPAVTSPPLGQVASTPVLVVTSNDLTYRGEGADHIVLGLKCGQVLRIRKTPVGGAEATTREELLRRAARDLDFLMRVGRPMLGTLLTDPARLVLVVPRPDSALCDAVQQWRQGNRQDKEINRHGVACICPDATTIFLSRHDASVSAPLSPSLALSNTWAEGISQQYRRETSNVCIEIKPKQGFFDHSTPGLPLCRYCVKQFLKTGKDKSKRSSYCPLDLFSGCIARMQRAVDALIQSPQNNFKVFVDGKPVSDCQRFSYLRDVIIAALIFDFTSGRATLKRADARLSKKSALGKLLTFQKLDCLGVFKASRLYLSLSRLLGGSEAVDAALYDLAEWPTPALDHLSDLGVHEPSDNSLLQQNGEFFPFQNAPHEKGSRVNLKGEGEEKEEEEEEEKDARSKEDMVRLLQSYLFSITAKDLSLMILLSGPHYGSPPHYSFNTSPFIVEVEAGVWFQCQVTGVDVVAKPTTKILKHERDYKALRDMLLRLRSQGNAPSCHAV